PVTGLMVVKEPPLTTPNARGEAKTPFGLRIMSGPPYRSVYPYIHSSSIGARRSAIRARIRPSSVALLNCQLRFMSSRTVCALRFSNCFCHSMFFTDCCKRLECSSLRGAMFALAIAGVDLFKLWFLLRGTDRRATLALTVRD